MALPVVQAVGTPQTGTGNISPAWPTHQSGDIGFLIVECNDSQNVVLGTPAGFALLAYPQQTSTTNGTRLTVFWKRATSSSEATPTVTDPGDHAYGVIVTVRGAVSSADPVEVFLGNQKNTASTSMSWPAVRTITNDCLILNIATRGNDAAGASFSSPSNGNLSSVTEQFDNGTTDGSGGGIIVVSGGLATAGDSGATTGTVGSSKNAYLTIAIRSQFPATGIYRRQSRVFTQSEASAAFVAEPLAGSLILVDVAMFTNAPASNMVSDSEGNTYTRTPAGSINDGNNNNLAMFYAKNIANNGSFALSLSGADFSMVISEYVGADTTSPLDQSNSATSAGSTTPSTSVTTSIDGELYHVTATSDGNDYDNFTPGTNYQLNGNGLRISDEMRIGTEHRVTNQGTITGSFTLPSTFSWAIIMASFKAATAAETASVDPVLATFQVQSVTATHRSTASVDPVLATFTIPPVTATYVEVRTASVDPVLATFQVQSVTANYNQVNAASVDPVLAVFSVQAVTAINVGRASVDPILAAFAIQDVSATHRSTASVDPVLATFAIQSVTAINRATAAVDPLLMVVEVQAVSATHKSTATVDPVLALFSVQSVAASADAVASADVDPVLALFAVQAVAATHRSTASVDPLLALFSVQDVAATHRSTAQVDPVLALFAVQAVAATHRSTAAVDPVLALFTVNDANATHRSRADVEAVLALFTVQDVTALQHFTAAADPLLALFTIQEVLAQFVNLDIAHTTPVALGADITDAYLGGDSNNAVALGAEVQDVILS